MLFVYLKRKKKKEKTETNTVRATRFKQATQNRFKVLCAKFPFQSTFRAQKGIVKKVIMFVPAFQFGVFHSVAFISEFIIPL